MTSRLRPSWNAPRRTRVGGALSGLALFASLLAPVSAAFAQDRRRPTVSLIRDTEIEAILHKDADPIFAAAGLDPKSGHDLHRRRPRHERLHRSAARTCSSTPA